MHFFERKLDIFTCLIGAQNMCTSASVFNIDVISRRLKPNIFFKFCEIKTGRYIPGVLFKNKCKEESFWRQTVCLEQR